MRLHVRQYSFMKKRIPVSFEVGAKDEVMNNSSYQNC
jgi:hypothetical protein